jgi:lysine 2,3-aminomutase
MPTPQGIQNEAWTDWRWQMRHRITDLEGLRDLLTPTADEVRAIRETESAFRWAVTPYYASLIDPENEHCPIRRQVIPRSDEMTAELDSVLDPLEEVAHSPVKNVIHNYVDRVAFCVTAHCAIYCRYCLRKRMVGSGEFMMSKTELRQGIDYIASHPEIRDVLLTGGDPLILGDDQIDWILTGLRRIPHVDIVRIGSRMPVKLPYRITEGLCSVLSRHHPLWLNTHFNHPRELTEDAAAAVDRLLCAGVPVGNQTVLLEGVNNDVETMRELMAGLVRTRVRPYYLYQAQVIGGTGHFRTPIEEGMALMESLQGRLTGFAIPKYVLDTPFGKVPLNRSYVLGRHDGAVIMRTPRGQYWAEPNPPPRNESLRLPPISVPPGTATLSEEAGVYVPEYAP